MKASFLRITACLCSVSLFAETLSQGDVSCQRRAFLSTSTSSAAYLLLGNVQPVSAGVTDETGSFAETWWNQAATESSSPAASSSNAARAPSVISSEDDDVVTIRVSKKEIQQRSLGLELSDVEFKTQLRVYVKSVLPGSVSSEFGVQRNWIVIGLNGQSTERTNAEGVAIMLSRALKQAPSEDSIIELRFRDPSVFRSKLKNLGADETVTTQVAPAGDTTQRNTDGSIRVGSVTEQVDQKVSVSQLVPPKMCTRGAKLDDLVEISYIGRVVETGEIFDGSAIKINGQAIPGRADDVSLYFVLGKQPFGQFPPGWDVGLMGICVGERRRILVPPVLAYGSKGLPRRGIPPDATLQYDVTLVSLNGLSTPQ